MTNNNNPCLPVGTTDVVVPFMVHYRTQSTVKGIVVSIMRRK